MENASDGASGEPSNAAESVAGAPRTESIPPVETPAPAAIKPKGLNLFGGKRPNVGITQESASGSSDASGNGKEHGAGDSERSNVPSESSGSAGGLHALAGFGADLDSGAGSLATIAGMDHIPSDHVAPTAPPRITEGLDEQQQAFNKLLDSIYAVFDDSDLFVASVSRIMMELGDNPHLEEMILPDDDNTIIRGMRMTAGMARIRKKEAKEKRAGSTRKRAEPSFSASELDGLNSLGAMDFD